MTKSVQLCFLGNRECGMLLLEWVIAFALLASFALLVIAFLPLLAQQLDVQQEQREATLMDYFEQQIATSSAGHRQLLQLQEGTL